MGNLIDFPGERQIAVDLERRRAALERRLEDGYERIDQAIVNGADVSTWETFWIELLSEFEAVCDELREAA